MLIDEEERYRVNAFDWKTEFSQVFIQGGFDVVMGNPPWGADFSEDELDYLRKQSKSIIVRMIDSFMYFVYQATNKLDSNGYFGMILPDVILYQQDNVKLREFILNNYGIDRILNMGNVFVGVTRPACIVVAQKGKPAETIRVIDVSDTDKAEKNKVILDNNKFQNLLQSYLYKIPSLLFVTRDPTRYDIWGKVNNVKHERLEHIVDDDGIQRGVSPDLKKAFLVESKIANQFKLEKTKLKKVITGGKQVKRYFIDYPDLWLIYTNNKDDFSKLPNIKAYIEQFKDEITCKEVEQKKHSLYALHRARQEEIFTKPTKFVGVITEDEIIVSIDSTQVFATDGIYLFGVREQFNKYYVMGILNSNLMKFVYRLLAIEEGRVLAQVKPTTLAQLPIRSINFSDPAEKSRHDKMVALVERMLELHKQSPKTPQEQEMVKRENRVNG